jgi:phosphonate transport system ATP-binding protein
MNVLPAVVMAGVGAGYASGTPDVVSNIDLEVAAGEWVAIVGPSGGGKTTLIRLMAGLLAPRRGRVEYPLLDGRGRRTPGAIGCIPQNLGLVRNQSVRQNVLLGAVSRLNFWGIVTGRYPTAEVLQAEQVLAQVGLAGRGGDRIESLSGGERRRVAIARSLLQRPRVLLADELLAEIDHHTADSILELLEGLRLETGLTVVLVDHHIEMAHRTADRVMVVAGGRVVGQFDPRKSSADHILEHFHASSTPPATGTTRAAS